MVSFFETPSWCIKGKYMNDCKNPINNPTVEIPNSNIPFMERYTYWVLEIVMLLFLCFT